MNLSMIYGVLTARSNSFSFQIKTDNAGVSSSTQFKLPLESSGEYDFYVDWGDGNSDNITVWNQTETTHTYSVSGVYTVGITGKIKGWTFNNGGDRLKMLEILGFGHLNLGNSGGYFYGCQNMVLSNVSDVLDLTGTSTFFNAFRNCDSVTYIKNIDKWLSGSITVWQNAYRDMALFNDPNFQYLDMSGATTLESMLRLSRVFNNPIPLYWPNCTNTNQMLNEADAFNQPLGAATMGNVTTAISMLNKAYNFDQSVNSWDLSNLEYGTAMFYECYAFNQDLSSLQFPNLLDATDFMYGKTTANYSHLNSLYISLAAQTLQPNVTAGFGTIQYTSAASASRAILTGSPNNWILTDGGLI